MESMTSADPARPAHLGRRTVSLPATTVAAVEQRVGSRGFSRYTAQALARQLERDRLDEALEEMEQVNGPVDAETLEQADAAWHAALPSR